MSVKTHALLASSVAGLLAAVSVVASSSPAHAAEGQNAPCYGINKCKGMGACGGMSGGVSHSCGGQNACAGQGYLELPKETCLKIQGGRLTPEESKS